MKMNIITILFILLIFSCINYYEDHTILKIDYFENYDDNVKLAKDILYYKYDWFILDEVDTLNQDDLKQIRWQYFIQSTTKTVLFKIKINFVNKRLIENKENIINYFKKKVNEQVKYHFDYKNDFIIAEKNALKYLELLDNKKYDDFYQLSNSKLTSTIKKEDFIIFIENKLNKYGLVDTREYHSKQFYNNFPNTEKGKYFQFNYTINTKNGKKYNETIILEKNKKWEIVGYHII